MKTSTKKRKSPRRKKAASKKATSKKEEKPQILQTDEGEQLFDDDGKLLEHVFVDQNIVSQAAKHELTLRQYLFGVIFAKTRHGTMSAIGAGFSQKGAAVTPSQLLRNPKIQRVIKDRVNDLEKKIQDTSDLPDNWKKITLKEIYRMATSPEGRRTGFIGDQYFVSASDKKFALGLLADIFDLSEYGSKGNTKTDFTALSRRVLSTLERIHNRRG